jgi:hypothetical protein
MAGPSAILRMPSRPFAPEQSYSLEADSLVRRIGRTEARWPLASLRRMTLVLRRSPYGQTLRFARLRLGGHVETIVCGPDAGSYAAFVQALAAAAAKQAPDARFEAEGGRLAAILVMTAALLGAGAAAMALSALMAGLAPMALDLLARLGFLLILIFAITPWLGRAAPAPLDPLALPPKLLTGA